jgi:hypothetical protein
LVKEAFYSKYKHNVIYQYLLQYARIFATFAGQSHEIIKGGSKIAFERQVEDFCIPLKEDKSALAVAVKLFLTKA